MKIDGTGKIGPGGEISAKKQEKIAGSSFDSHLKEALGTKAEKTEKAQPVMPPPSIAPAVEVGKAINSKAVKQLDSMLSDLEIYKNSLANEDIPQSRLKPMSESINSKKDDLVSMLRMVDDPELKKLITDAAALVVNENSRFHFI